MKKTLCIVSSCIALATLMVVQCFAISRFDAYAYWANAQNSIGFIGNDITNMFNYSKFTGMTPPISIQSEFYKNGYYSNNTALFTQHTGGTASFDLYSKETFASWQFDSNNPTMPSSGGFTGTGDFASPSFWSLNNGLVINPNYGSMIRLAVSPISLSRNEGYSCKVNQMLSPSDTTLVGPNAFSFCLEWEFNDTFYGCQVVFCASDGKIFIRPRNFNWTDYGAIDGYSINIGNFTPNEYHDFEVHAIEDRYIVYLDGQVIETYSAVVIDSINANCPTFCYRRNMNAVAQSYEVFGYTVPESTVIVNLGRSVPIPAGENMEFYIHLKQGSVTNVTQETTVEFDYSKISQMSLVFDEQVAVVPIEVANDWLYVNIPSSDSDRTFNRCWFTFSTPYVNTNTGDSMRWDMEMAFSDLVFGDPNDIGLNPDVDPEQDKFHNDVINGIGGIKDDLSDIKQEIHDGFDNVSGILGDIESELSRDDTFDDVPAWSDADIENVIPESDALIQYEQVMANAYQTLEDANIKGAQTWWQNLYTVILTIPMAGMMAVIVSSLLILRALLGR